MPAGSTRAFHVRFDSPANLLKPQMDQLSFRGCERERERVAAGHDLEADRQFLSSGGPSSVEADGLA